jgi:hypothetical protein
LHLGLERLYIQKMDETIKPGFYHAYYKDHGWVIVHVTVYDGHKQLWEFYWEGTPASLVSRSYWQNYQRFTPIKSPDEVV